MPPKRGRKKKDVEAEPELSVEEHFSDDEVYDPPDEEEIVFEEAIARPQKLRLSDVNTSNLRLNKVDVRRYVQACNYSWVDFMKRNGVSDALKKLVDERRFEYEVVSDVFSALPDLANSESLDLYQTQIKPSQLSHLNSATKMANHMERQAKEDPPTHQEPLRLKFLECREIRYPTDTKKPDAYFGSGLDAYCKELWNNKDATAYNDKEFQTPSSALMVNIGNPVAAIAICPNADELGNELLALSAFPDEEWLTPDEEVNSYVQFYSYNPNDFNSAECRFLLEIPSQIVLDLKFCPNFVNVPGNPKAIDDSSDFLGLLAVSTSKGLVLIYRISKNLPEKIDGKVPIVSLKPSITLVHPEIQVKTSNSDGGTQEIGTSSRIPIFSLDWPPVDGGNLILAASEARRVMIWDLSETPEPREMTEEAYLQLSDTLLLPKLTLFEASWQSPPNTVCFLNENELVIAFRNRTILVYKVPECEVCLTESTPKSAGVVVTAAPATFRSFLSADATLANVDGILYAQTCYISLKEAGYEVALIPALNSHQLQIFDVKLCPRTGLCVSCGADGRLQHSINARNRPREVDGDFNADNLNFLTGRPIIHLIRHRKVKGIADVAEKPPPKKAKGKKKEEEMEDEKPKVLIKNEDVRQGNWMEIRCGDTSLIDLAQLKKHRTQLAQTLLDRRIESFTRVAISTRTAGLTAVGGEAGLVFVLPTLL